MVRAFVFWVSRIVYDIAQLSAMPSSKGSGTKLPACCFNTISFDFNRELRIYFAVPQKALSLGKRENGLISSIVGGLLLER